MSLNDRIYKIGEIVHEQVDEREKFHRGWLYSGWIKSLYQEESFDSYSAEYKLARLMSISPHIKWWHRLHSQNGAYIYYTSKDRYFPDFVALDDDGVYWIIEGKNEKGRDDTVVQKKRKAAESVVRKLLIEDDFSDLKWGYIIAYEGDVEKSDSWDDLKTFAQPITNEV